MKNILLATKNVNKKKELKKLLGNLSVKILTLRNIPLNIPHVVEDGKTFRQNAVKKALVFSRCTEKIVLAEDSGLAVRALGGKPGVRSSRFAHLNATSEENNAKLLKLMANVPAGKREAVFVSVIAIARKGVLLGTASGRCIGSIGFHPKGKNGFGYDPLFMPKGYKKTFAQFKTSFKNRISHRKKSLKKAKTIIQKFL